MTTWYESQWPFWSISQRSSDHLQLCWTCAAKDLSVSLHVSLSLCLSVSLPLSLSVSVSVSVSVSLSLSLSLSLSVSVSHTHCSTTSPATVGRPRGAPKAPEDTRASATCVSKLTVPFSHSSLYANRYRAFGAQLGWAFGGEFCM